MLASVTVSYFITFSVLKNLIFTFSFFTYSQFKMARKKKLGVGAKCSCYTTFLHPANTFSERYVNQLYKHETKNILCIRKEEKVVHMVKRVP